MNKYLLSDLIYANLFLGILNGIIHIREALYMKLRLKKISEPAIGARMFVFSSEEPTTWIAGQYLRLYVNTDQGQEEHWFTVSSAPYEKDIAITTRMSGSRYKIALHALSPGDTVEADAIKGNFVWQDDDRDKLFIAGGIGVTPFRSMILERNHNKEPINAILLYFNRTEDIAFRQEFDEITGSRSDLRVIYITGTSITSSTIIEKVNDFKERTVYISGAEAMVGEIGDQLKKEGLPADQLKQDYFPGYDDATY